MTLRLKALIFFRAVFITLLLGSAYLFRIEYFYAHPNAISYLIIVLYVLTIIYSLLIHRIRNLFLFTYVQLIIDVFAEITLIYITGGIESWFSFTLILTVLSSSIILNKKAGYVIASLSSILYGGLLDLQFYRVLPIEYADIMQEKQFLYNIFIHTISLYITSYLAGYLSSRLEKTVEKLEEKDTHLKDLELFNMKVIESLPSGLFTTDVNGDVLIFNRAAEKISGTPGDTLIGSKIDRALPFLSFPLKEGRHEATLKAGKDDQKIIGINISVLRDINGKETGFIGVFQDLTQLKKLEAAIKQKEQMAAIGELSANIAHEIRNPIASMRGSIEMLRDDRIPARHREKLMDIALKEMERLNNIVTDFLTYSKPRSPEKKIIDLHLLLEETLSLLNNIEQNKGNITIRRDFSGPLYVNADAQNMRQVFWNLGLNAIESMENGGELIVSTRQDHDSVRIKFSDTGAGISPENREKIFFPFFTTKDRGTGLGLAIAYRIIEEHNGRLSVQSIPGIKTEFEIILENQNGN
ncbi:MAG: PAS domain S-box protein [Nitrospirae bacterium]|nr:PAS domain S-box protein [Nitrospirota bacterium]